MHGKSGSAFVLLFGKKQKFCLRTPLMAGDTSIESFKSALNDNHEWPCFYTFKFIVPQAKTAEVLSLFADDPVAERPSKSGRFISYTMELHVESADHVLSIYNRVSHIKGVITL